MAKLLYSIFIVLLLSSCDPISSLPSNRLNTLPFSVKTTDTLRMKLEIKSKRIERLEDIKAVFKLRNITDHMVSYGFPSGCQYGYTVTKNKHILFDSRANLLCTGALSGFKLKPYQMKSFSITLNIFDINKKLDKGMYELNAFLLEGHTPSISTSFKLQ